jgi:hypothetical protein
MLLYNKFMASKEENTYHYSFVEAHPLKFDYDRSRCLRFALEVRHSRLN